MALLIESIAADVLRPIGIQVHESRLVGVHRFERGCFYRELTGCKAAEFSILLPEVGLDEFGRREKSKDRNVSFG